MQVAPQVTSAKENWFCNSCDVIISELITKSNKPEAASTMLTDNFDTAIHKSLDKATGHSNCKSLQ